MKPPKLLLLTPVWRLFHNNFTGKNIRKLYKDGLIMRRQVHMHSTSRVKRYHEAKRKGK
jgi:ribosomal protein L19E